MKYFLHLLLLLLITTFGCSESNDDIASGENESLIASDLTVSMTENPENGEIIGLVNASSSSNILSFTIISQAPADVMMIDSSIGELTVANKIEFEYQINPVITAMVEVSDGISTETVSITVNLTERTKVYIGDVTLKTQEDVDNFGAEKYTDITGYLIIGGLDGVDISDLAPMIGLNNIGNYLVISFNEVLTNLDGLASLLSVKTFVQINNNTNVININGLRNLKDVGDSTFLSSGSITISFNPQLENLDGLLNLKEVTAYIHISDNVSLENIDGLRNIETIEHLLVIKNDALVHINGIVNTSFIGNEITIKQNIGLIDFCGLQTALVSNNFTGLYEVDFNGFNPTQQDIIDGNCSL